MQPHRDERRGPLCLPPAPACHLPACAACSRPPSESDRRACLGGWEGEGGREGGREGGTGREGGREGGGDREGEEGGEERGDREGGREGGRGDREGGRGGQGREGGREGGGDREGGRGGQGGRGGVVLYSQYQNYYHDFIRGGGVGKAFTLFQNSFASLNISSLTHMQTTMARS